MQLPPPPRDQILPTPTSIANWHEICQSFNSHTFIIQPRQTPCFLLVFYLPITTAREGVLDLFSGLLYKNRLTRRFVFMRTLFQQARSSDRYQHILDAALQVFSRRGYRDASVDDIAGTAQTSKGGIYFHFPNKEAIFLALLQRTATRLLEKIEDAAASTDDPIVKADAALLTVLRTFVRHRALARLFMVEALGAGREFHQRMAEIRNDFTMIIKRHLDKAVEEGVIAPIDTEIAARAWFGSLNEVITQWILSGRPKDLEDAYAVLRIFLLRSIGVQDPVPHARRKR